MRSLALFILAVAPVHTSLPRPPPPSPPPNAYALQEHLNCATCTAAGGWWCAAGAGCAPYVLSPSQLLPGDALLCPTAASWARSCTGIATGPIGNDPMYGAQSWVYDLINVGPVWSMGYTGQGVQIAINDDGIDLTLPDFGPLPGGAAKFDAEGSCIGAQTCLGGGTSFQGVTCESGTKTNPRGTTAAYGSHGTTCAAIALGNANSDCSVGIAPGAKIAGVHDGHPPFYCPHPCMICNASQGAPT